MKLELKGTPGEVMRAVETLQEFGEAKGIPAGILFGLTLALEECASNILNHALQRDPAQTFEVTLEHTGEAISIELRDSGIEFDPALVAPGDGMADDDAEPGGWGIFLVRKYTDTLIYSREGGRNVLRLMKRLPLSA
jgi:anti-sigma regulatory factor (Ser/Thr protein kinase)